MKVITDIYNYRAVPCAATIGSFDGVHLGHRSMLEELSTKAKALGLPTMVVTFAKHPRLLFGTANEPFLLSSNEEKISLLTSLGVDYCVMLDFNSKIANMSAEHFMKEVLNNLLGVKLLCIGYDHHFGKPQEGVGYEQYMEYGKSSGINVFKALPFYIDDDTVSSSKIRKALIAGEINSGTKMLGQEYSFTGEVVHGAGIGHSLGFPTANIQLHDEMKILPANGVYEVSVQHKNRLYKGVMNIGTKPTLGENKQRTIEVHIIDFSDDIYGTDITIAVKRRLRGEIAFDSIEALQERIKADVEIVRKEIDFL